MANSNTPFGLRPIYTLDGTPINVFEAFIPLSDTTPTGIGDPIVFAGTSNSTIIQGREIGTLPSCIRATAGGGAASIAGVIVGVEPVSNTSAPYRLASTQRIVKVCPVQNVVFEIQSNGTSAITAVGANADIVFTSTPNTVTGISGAELNEGSVATTATLQLKIIGSTPSVDNEIGADGKYNVIINTNALSNGQVGV